MKRNLLLVLAAAMGASFYFSNKGFTNSEGRAGVSGAPGETTCSQSGCHGAGSGGLADNAGPGAVEISSNMANWSFSPGQTYRISVKNTDMNGGVYGLCLSVLDNAVNRSCGTLIITDAAHTEIKTRVVSGNTRQYITHLDGAGATTSKPGVFEFDWTAPSGVNAVTFYVASLAANDDAMPNRHDNVYTAKQVATLANPTGLIPDLLNENDKISIYPNPATTAVKIGVSGLATVHSTYTVYALDGTKMTENLPYRPGGEISVEGWKPGTYLLQMTLNGEQITKPFIVKKND